MTGALLHQSLDLFECFDGYWQENFGSAVFVMSFRGSETFRGRLLELLRRRSGAHPALSEDPNSYVATREQGFNAPRKGETRRGRYDILLSSGAKAITIENKVWLSTTREQIGKQRQALESRFAKVLVCSLSRHSATKKNEDISLCWADIATLMKRIPRREQEAIGSRLAQAVEDFFGGHDMEFKGFSTRDQPYRTHLQRRLLLEALLRRISRGERRWYDNRNHESESHYQSACFTDAFGGRGRYIGFYDYSKGDRSALELYWGEGDEQIIDGVPWPKVRQTFRASRRDLEKAVDRLAERFKKKLEAFAPAGKSTKRGIKTGAGGKGRRSARGGRMGSS